MDKIEDLTKGKYVITTYSGTRHYLDLDKGFAIRKGAEGREWTSKKLQIHPHAALSGSQPKVAVSFIDITPDGSEIYFTSIKNVEVGKCMYLENDVEWRVTSTIQSIEIWEENSNG